MAAAKKKNPRLVITEPGVSMPLYMAGSNSFCRHETAGADDASAGMRYHIGISFCWQQVLARAVITVRIRLIYRVLHGLFLRRSLRCSTDPWYLPDSR